VQPCNPFSVESLARIDRLPPDEKDLLQTLAVLGKEVVRRRLRRAIETLTAARPAAASEVTSKG